MGMGKEMKGGVMNVVGDRIEGMKEVEKREGFGIEGEGGKLEEVGSREEVLFRGMKVMEVVEG